MTFTATVTSSGSPVTSGIVTFKKDGTALCSNVAVNASGQAACTATISTEGAHAMEADYSGSLFGSSIGTLIQVVNNHTVVNGKQFCNSLSGVTINDNAVATPYPSNIFVSGLPGTISSVTLDLKSLTEASPQDLAMLLVGPNGAKFELVSDVGSNLPVTGINLTLDDAAANLLPQSPLASGTFRPANYLPDFFFPLPAPPPPYENAAPAGSATFGSVFAPSDPNGDWRLYVFDRVLGGGSSSMDGGWCLNFTTPQKSLTALAPAKVWVGLKNSDSVGLRIDLRTQVFINSSLIGSGELDNIGTGSSGFNNAILNTIPLTLTSGPVGVSSGDHLKITVSARRTCFGAGHNSGAPRLWYNGAPIDSGPNRDAGSRFGETLGGAQLINYLRETAALSPTPGSSDLSIDITVDSSVPCTSGRPFTPFGTWNTTIP